MSDFVVDFPTLGDIGDAWLAQHARVPDGFDRGAPFHQVDWQFWCMANHYRIREDAEWIPERPLLNQAFNYRRSQIVGPQKVGKGPWSAGIVALEAAGPSIFGGWATKGDGYACSEHGCGCGWEYEYNAGEPMGIRHPSPLIQLTALSEDQVANVYRPLRAMITLGPLSDLLSVRGSWIKIAGKHDDPELDRIDAVTSSANTRVGNPISFALQDESGLATKQNKMVDVYEAQRRGAAGMGGRTMETTNAWDPAQNSVAQRTHESGADDVFRYWREPPANLSYRNKRERRQIHQYVYVGSPWVDLDSIEGEAAELMRLDPAQAERFFGNRVVSGSGVWMLGDEWKLKDEPIKVAKRTRVCGGFDGSDNNDWTGIRLETLEQYQFMPEHKVGRELRPMFWNPAEWQGRIPRSEVLAAFDWIEQNFEVERFYLDPMFWETEIDLLASKYGESKYLKWETNRLKPMHAALERFRTDVTNPDATFRHDGDKTTAQHIKNAVMRARPGEKYLLGKPADHQKIDLAMSSVLAHEAVMDAIADGALQPAAEEYVYI
jgi:hypothetical protein